MSININIICDHGAVHAGGAIGVRFESLTETFGDVVAGLRELGWYVETDGSSREARCLCPEHAPRALSASELFDSLPDPIDALDF